MSDMAMEEKKKKTQVRCPSCGYRSIEINSDMSKQQKAFYRRMKETYALPLPEGEQERQDAILEALMGDGNVSGLL